MAATHFATVSTTQFITEKSGLMENMNKQQNYTT